MMFRKLYNQAVLTGELEPDGPILIVQGGAALDPVVPDLAFVRTRQGDQSTVYLPGSSLKGVLRAHGERLLATYIGLPAAESPFAKKRHAPRRGEAERRRKKNDTAGVYKLSCEADRLFGSLQIAGRFRIGDAYPTKSSRTDANATEIRYGVAIDRSKQSTFGGALFEQEAVTGGRFHFQATFENFELWMVSLVLQVLRDLDVGLVQIGHAKSRGFGSVHVLSPALELRYPGPAPGRLEGVGAREPDPEVREAYRLSPDDHAALSGLPDPKTDGLFSSYRLEEWPALHGLRAALTEKVWTPFVQRATRELGHGA